MAKTPTPNLGKLLTLMIDEMHLRDLDAEPLLERMQRHLIGGKVPEDSTPVRTLTPRERFFVDMYADWSEILQSLFSLELSADFLHKLQPRQATASLILYHVEKHLEEVYILKGRMVVFLKRLSRLLKRRGLDDASALMLTASAAIESAFKGIVSTRGSHVHERRFRDENLSRIETFDLLLRGGTLRELDPLRRIHVRDALAAWRKTMTANVENAHVAVDQLALSIQSAIESLAPPPPK